MLCFVCVCVCVCVCVECTVGGQVYTECGSACDATCDAPVSFCTLACVAKCQCPIGQVVDAKSNKCVKQADCPKPSTRTPVKKW